MITFKPENSARLQCSRPAKNPARPVPKGFSIPPLFTMYKLEKKKNNKDATNIYNFVLKGSLTNT